MNSLSMVNPLTIHSHFIGSGQGLSLLSFFPSFFRTHKEVEVSSGKVSRTRGFGWVSFLIQKG
jgi:hypothetical protein